MLDLAHVRRIEAENGRLKSRIEELEHEVRMLKQLRDEMPDDWSLPDAPGVSLTPSERAIVHRLHIRDGQTVSKLGLQAVLYGLDPDIDCAEVKVIDVFICKVRRKLRGTPWRIMTARGIGYYLVRDDAARLSEVAA